MTKLNAQVKGSLNITSPGIQIWRIEVSLSGHGGGRGLREGRGLG